MGGVAKSQKVSTVILIILIWSPTEAVLCNHNLPEALVLWTAVLHSSVGGLASLGLLKTFSSSHCALSAGMTSYVACICTFTCCMYSHVHACGHTCTRHVATCACMCDGVTVWRNSMLVVWLKRMLACWHCESIGFLLLNEFTSRTIFVDLCDFVGKGLVLQPRAKKGHHNFPLFGFHFLHS